MPRKSLTGGRIPRGFASRSTAAATAETPAQSKPKRIIPHRRNPYELVRDLRNQRDKLDKTYRVRRTKLDEKIAELESKYSDLIAVSELATNLSPTQIDEKEQELLHQLKLFRRAKKLTPVG